MVFRTLLEHLPIAGTLFFLVPLWYRSTVFPIMSLSLVSKLKLNSRVLWVLKYSSTHCGYSNTWVSKVFHPCNTVKVLKYLAVLVLDLLNSLACHSYLTRLALALAWCDINVIFNSINVFIRSRALKQCATLCFGHVIPLVLESVLHDANSIINGTIVFVRWRWLKWDATGLLFIWYKWYQHQHRVMAISSSMVPIYLV